MAWWSWSLRQRLAVAICGTLAMGIIVFGIVAWNEVRTAAVEAAQTRLEVVTRRIADLLSGSVALQKAQVANMSRDPSVRRIATGEDGEARDSAVARLRRADSLSNTTLAIQVWDATGNIVFSSSPFTAGMDDSGRRDMIATLQVDDSAAVGPFRLDGNQVTSATFGAGRGSAGGPGGGVGWRRVAAKASCSCTPP